jgi:hypothetical protein
VRRDNAGILPMPMQWSTAGHGLPAGWNRRPARDVDVDVRRLFLAVAASVLLGSVLSGCTPQPGGAADVAPGSAALRGFGLEVDQAVAPQVPLVHLRTCGRWGCHDQDVPISLAGGTTTLPCPSTAAPDVACGIARVPGPGPGFGYAPVPPLTFDPVTVTVTTPPGAAFPIDAEVTVQPFAVCPDQRGHDAGSTPEARPTCPDGTPQAHLRIAADATVSQSRRPGQ